VSGLKFLPVPTKALPPPKHRTESERPEWDAEEDCNVLVTSTPRVFISESFPHARADTFMLGTPLSSFALLPDPDSGLAAEHLLATSIPRFDFVDVGRHIRARWAAFETPHHSSAALYGVLKRLQSTVTSHHPRPEDFRVVALRDALDKMYDSPDPARRSAVMLAQQVLHEGLMAGVTPSRVATDPDGGVVVYFFAGGNVAHEKDRAYAAITCSDDGCITELFNNPTTDDLRANDIDRADFPEALERIREFLS
jgi:hypothetical protein